MAHAVETQSLAPSSPLAASTRRKRLILLCGEELRPVACALEVALRARGWEVDVEFGADARPWVQKIPPVRPSVRVLCVPGTVDRELADQLRTAFRPEPDADLQILGVDDSPGLVQEIERLAGVRTPPRRPLAAAPRLAHATLVESQVRRERTWRLGAASVLAAFALTLGAASLMSASPRAPERGSESLATGITSVAAPRPADLDAESSRFHDPVLAAMGPAPSGSLDSLEDDDEVIVLLEDDAEPEGALPPEETRPLDALEDDELALAEAEGLRRVDVLATPLAGTEPVTDLAAAPLADELADAVTAPLVDDASVALARPLPTLPPGFLPVAGLPTADAAPPERRLPSGLLPVAGLTAASPVAPVDPFETTDVVVTEPVTTVDPFAP